MLQLALHMGREADFIRRAIRFNMSKNVRPNRRKEPKLREMDVQGWKSLGIALLKIAIACALAIGIPYGAYAVYRHYAQSGAFLPKSIEISGNLRQSDATVLDASGLSPEETNLAETDIRTVEEAIETLPWVRKADVRVKLPDSVSIMISEYEPLGIVNDGTLALIDTNGEFIKRWRDDDEIGAPIVTLDKPLEERKHEAVRAFEIAATAHKLGYNKKIHEIQYDKGIGYTLYTETGEIRIGYDRFEARIKRLTEVDAELESRGVVARYILLDADDDLTRIAVKPASAQPKTEDAPAAGKTATDTQNSATAAEKNATDTQNSATAAEKTATDTQNSATAAEKTATDTQNSATAAKKNATDTQNSATAAKKAATKAEDAPEAKKSHDDQADGADRDSAQDERQPAPREIPDDDDMALPPAEISDD